MAQITQLHTYTPTTPLGQLDDEIIQIIAAINALDAAGYVVGPASAVADRIAAFDGTTGKLLKDGGKTIAELALASHTHTKANITDLETITTTPTASAVPKADGSNKIAAGWLPNWTELTPSSLSAFVTNDWSPTGFLTANVVRVSSSAGSVTRLITGMAAGAAGQVITISAAVGTTYQFSFSNEDTRSTAANRFYLGRAPVVVIQSGESVSFYYDSTLSRWVLVSLAHPLKHSPLSATLVYALLDATTGLQTSVSGTGATAARSVNTRSFGQIDLATGTTSSGRSAVATSSVALWGPTGRSVLVFHGHVEVSALSTSAQRYTARVGFLDSLSADSADGVYFRYADNVNSGNWQLVARNNSAETVTNSSTPPQATQLTGLAVVVYPGEDAADFYVAATTAGALVYLGTVAGIPEAIARAYGAGASIVKSVGSTSVALTVYPFTVSVFAPTP